MSQTLLNMIRRARVEINAHLDTQVKTAYLLMRMANSYRVKTALSKSDIDRAVQQHLLENDVYEAPNLPWGDIFSRPVRKLGRQKGWSQDLEDRILDGIVQDLISGMNLDTGSVFKSGNLAEMVKDLLNQGKDALDITKLISNLVGRRALSKEYKYTSGYRDLSTKSIQPGGYDDTKDEKGNLFENVLSLSPMSRSEASKWMSFSKNDPVLRDLLRQIDRILERRAGPAAYLVWQVAKDNPDFESYSDLARTPVTVVDPDTGREVTTELYKALVVLGFTKTERPDTVARYFQKLAPLLKKIKPVVLDALRERERG